MPESDLTTLETIDALIVLLNPVADGGNLWAVGWRLRLMLASGFNSTDEEALKTLLTEFRESLSSIFDALMDVWRWCIDNDLVPQPEGEVK